MINIELSRKSANVNLPMTNWLRHVDTKQVESSFKQIQEIQIYLFCTGILT